MTREEAAMDSAKEIPSRAIGILLRRLIPQLDVDGPDARMLFDVLRYALMVREHVPS